MNFLSTIDQYIAAQPNIKELGILPKGTRFKLNDGYETEFVITRSGFWRNEVHFRPAQGTEHMTTVRKDWKVEVVS